MELIADILYINLEKINYFNFVRLEKLVVRINYKDSDCKPDNVIIPTDARSKIIEELQKRNYIICGDYIVKCNYIKIENDENVVYPGKFTLIKDKSSEFSTNQLVKIGNFYINISDLEIVRVVDDKLRVNTKHGNFKVIVGDDCPICYFNNIVKPLLNKDFRCASYKCRVLVCYIKNYINTVSFSEGNIQLRSNNTNHKVPSSEEDFKKIILMI